MDISSLTNRNCLKFLFVVVAVYEAQLSFIRSDLIVWQDPIR